MDRLCLLRVTLLKILYVRYEGVCGQAVQGESGMSALENIIEQQTL